MRQDREGVVSIALASAALIATIACTVLAGPGVISDGMAVAGMAVALFAALLPVVTAASATVARLGSIGRLLSANILQSRRRRSKRRGALPRCCSIKPGRLRLVTVRRKSS